MDPFECQGLARAIYHLSLGVADIGRTRNFYTAILNPLGYKLLHEVKEGDTITALGWGLHFPELWTNIPSECKCRAPGAGVHVAFHAPSRDAVDEFHRRALLAGGRDNGAPGYRLDYDPGYYGAFVFDPDGNRLEAMWFDHNASNRG